MISKIYKLKNFVGSRIFFLFILSVILGFAWFLVELFFVVLTQQLLYVLDILNAPNQIIAKYFGESLTSTLILMLVFGIVRFSILFFKTYLRIIIGEEFVSYYRQRLLKLLVSIDGEVSTHKFVHLFSEQAGSASLFLAGLSSALTTLVSLACLTFFALRLAPIEMILASTVLLFMILPLKFLNRQIEIAGKNYVKESSNFNHTILESLKNIFILRIYRKIDESFSGAIVSVKNYEKNAKDYYKIYSLKHSYPQFIGLVIICAILFLSKLYLKTPPVQLLAFFYLFIRITQAASELSASSAEIKKNIPGINYLKSEVSTLETLANNKSKRTFKELEVKENSILIELNNISFSYSSNSKILDNFSCKLPPGKLSLIKGDSGTGKSTLLLLIFGLIEPESGQILFNEKINNSFAFSNSKDIAYVGPENFVIEGTLKENFKYLNDRKVLDEEIKSLMKEFEMDNIAALSNDGLNTKITLDFPMSTGQKQRISIIRALLRKPKILVFDEATSNLDIATEEKVMNYIKKIAIRDKINIICISHRENFRQYCDQVIQLQKV